MFAMISTGYSGTPLAKKLGIKDGYKVRVVNVPAHYYELFTDWPENVSVWEDEVTKKNLIHYFTKSAENLANDIASLRAEIEVNGVIWISWPKKSSKITTDITEDTVRTLALSNGLVDVKVCAVDDVWSGLKLVIPVKLRT
jgi:hypothetical protein